VVEYDPEGQEVHTAEDDAPSTVENDPDEQPMQAPSDEEPVMFPYVPAGHVTQVKEPEPAEYVPFAHGSQADQPLLLYEPAEHSVHETLPFASDTEPGGQRMQSVALDTPLLGL
jgi:hypothetical protein